MTLYAYPRLPRTGIGNMLFPWARAECFCRKTGAVMIAPKWTHFMRIGPWLRGERDKRYYMSMFSSKGYISGLAKCWAFLRTTAVPETDGQKYVDDPSCARNVRVEFSGMDGWFAPFVNESEYVRSRLIDIASARIRTNVDAFEGTPIALHVRRGDFVELEPGQKIPEGKYNYRLPLQWYITALNELRETVGHPVASTVFSDGTNDELSELLDLDGVRRADEAPALADILRLSKCGCIIASGSTFSMWGTFLGQRPALWYPGQLRDNATADHPEWQIETDEHGRLSEKAKTVLTGYFHQATE